MSGETHVQTIRDALNWYGGDPALNPRQKGALDALYALAARLQAAEAGERSTQYEADHYRARLREVEFSLREAEEALRQIAGMSWPTCVLHSARVRARSYFAAQETNDPPPPRDSGISSA